MEPNQSQVQSNNDMTPEEAKASLGIATFLQQQMMPQPQEQPVEGQEMPEIAPQQEQAQETQNTPPPAEEAPQNEEPDPMENKMAEMEKSMTEKLDQIRKELKEDNQREMDALKKTIENALK